VLQKFHGTTSSIRRIDLSSVLVLKQSNVPIWKLYCFEKLSQNTENDSEKMYETTQFGYLKIIKQKTCVWYNCKFKLTLNNFRSKVLNYWPKYLFELSDFHT